MRGVLASMPNIAGHGLCCDGPGMRDERRKFCQLVGLSITAACLKLGASGCSKAPGMDVWTINAFKAADVVLNGTQLVQLSAEGHTSQNLYFCRDAGGLYVMSANCTHARCVLQFNPTDPMTPGTPDFECNCHGSTFDYNGQHQTPPAPSPLPHYQLTVEADGTLVVDAGTEVDPSTRTRG